MANEEKRNPTTAEEAGISKAQSAQQAQAGEQPETDERRTNIEGASLQPKERAEEESGIIGAGSERDTSIELVEDEDLDEDDEFKPDGQ